MAEIKDGGADASKPGSQAAIDIGCRCPRMDNAHGLGRGADGAKFGWVISGECPLHGTTASHREKQP